MKKSLILLCSLFIIICHAQSQQLPTYGQYYINPYVYNPSYAGSLGYPVMFLTHRQQWRGIDGAPVTSNLNYHTPVGRSVGLGLNITTDKFGAYNTSSALFSASYAVMLGEEHFLRFGLSAGFGMNKLDFDRIENPNDPAVANALTNNIFLDGQFGMSYHNKGFNFGLAMPRLFEADVHSSEYFNPIALGERQRFYVHGGYRMKVNPQIDIEPTLLYRIETAFDNQVEAGGIVHFNKVGWLGSSYRHQQGLNYFAGFILGDFMQVGYGYEMATAQAAAYVDGTHEIMLSLRIGEKRKPQKKAAPKPKPAPVVEKEAAPVVLAEKKPEKQFEAPVNEIDLREEIEEMVAVKDRHPLEMEPGNYVITGVFSTSENAERAIQMLSKKGLTAAYGFSSRKGFYYVYVNKDDDLNQTRQARSETAQIEGMNESWVLSIKDGAPEARRRTDLSSDEFVALSDDPVLNADVHQQILAAQQAADERIDIIKRTRFDANLQPGTYVVVGVHKTKEQAQNRIKALSNDNITAEAMYSEIRDLHYIVTYDSRNLQRSIIDRDNLREQVDYPVWLLIVE